MTTPLPSAGRYQLHARIGQGATGVVYEAVDPDRARQVAVKVLLPDVAQDGPRRQQFLRETRAVAKLRHRHLAAVYDVAGNDESPFVAMERLRGRTLAERLTMTPAPTLLESLEIVEQVCLGLQFAHEHGIVHRNVTPANIWLLEDGSVKLTDFGLPSASAPTAGDTRRLIGRVAYLAPEQITGSTADGRADIFSTGVVLYELVTGRRPFEADSVAAMLEKVIGQPHDPVLARIPAEAERLEEVCRLALAKDPERRYRDALSMAADLTFVRLELLGGVVAPEAAPEESSPEPEVEPGVPAYSGADSLRQGYGGPPEPHAKAEAPGPQRPYNPQTSYDLQPPSSLPAPYSEETWESTPLPQGLGGLHDPQKWRSAGLAERLRATIESTIRENPVVMLAGAAAVGLAIVVGAWLAWRTPPIPSGAGQTAGTANARTPPPATAARAEVRLESTPADAEVFLNGVALGAKTPVAIPIDRLRNAELRLVKPGYDPLVVRVTPEDVARQALSLQLVEEAPPIVVSGSAPFAFEVLSGRTVISRAATSHRFTVRGDQTLRVRAPDYYLDRSVTIPPGKPAVTLYVPPLGRLSVRVSPSLERCRVSVDGREFGTPPFPPVPYQSVVAGAHRVQLTCPDGSVRTENVTVEAARDRAAVFR
jgi:serine/threonine protein kinase